MPTRPVPGDDDDIVQQVVAASHHTGQAYAGQLPPGLQGIAGPFPAERPVLAAPPTPPASSSPAQVPPAAGSAVAESRGQAEA
eukprot:5507023-Alexandrium_andersonii.AAC.1